MQKIVDSHVHFWNPDNLKYQWLSEVPAINRSFLPADLPKLGQNWQVEKVVFVQADCIPEQSLDEAEWVSSLDASLLGGIVAFAPMELGDRVQSHLDALQDYSLVRGIRRLIQSEARGFSNAPEFVKAVQLLPQYGYSFDICIYAHQFPDILDLVKQCPNVEFILDHVGKADIKAGTFAPWSEHIKQLAEFPNVVCKLSGMVTEADHQHWTEADLTPYIEHVVSCFGAERLLFGSDWPVQRLAADYERWVTIAQNSVRHFSADEQNNFFYKNAERVYKL
jgi:L-fuconolactonase